MKLYAHPYSNAARRVHMLCEECAIPYTYETVDLMKGEQYAPDFLAINPNAKVPAIEDDGFMLWESNAIMRYLAEKYGASSWWPKEPEARARVDQWLDWTQTRLGPEAGKIMFNTLFAGDNGDKQAIESAKKWLEKILPVMDSTLSKSDYLCGDTLTLADLAAVTNIAYLEMCEYDLGAYPNVNKWYRALKQRPSFAATAPK